METSGTDMLHGPVTQGSMTRDRAIAVEVTAVGLLFLALYLGTLSGNLSIAHDSIHHVIVITDGRNLFHPHHLLYAPLCRVWLGLWRALGSHADSVHFLEMLNALFGAMTVALVFLFCRRGLRLRRLPSFVGATLVGTSFGMWYYSVCVEVYVIPTFFLMLAFCLLTLARMRWQTWAAMGLASGLAVLFHQTNVLFALPVVVGLVLRRTSRRPERSRLGPALPSITVYTLTAAPTVLVPYICVLARVIKPGSWSGAWRWLTDYAAQPQWGVFRLSTVPEALFGLGRSIIGGHFVFAVPRVLSAADRVLAGHLLEDERFLVREMSPLAGWTLIASGAAVIALVAVAVAFGLTRRRLRARQSIQPCAIVQHRRGRAAGFSPRGASNPRAPLNRARPSTVDVYIPVLLVWVAAYGAFFAWWEPTNLEFWIAPSLAAWMIVLTLVGRSRRAWNCLAIAALLLLCTNLFGSVRFLRDRKNDLYDRMCRPLAAAAKPGDAIVAGRRWIWGDYLAWYTKADVWCLTDFNGAADAVERLGSAIDAKLAAGHRVYVTADAIRPPAELALSNGKVISAYKRLWLRYEDQWRKVEKGGITYYILRLTDSSREEPQKSRGLQPARPFSSG